MYAAGQQVPGSWCSPPCHWFFNPCPKDVPPGTTATPSCNFNRGPSKNGTLGVGPLSNQCSLTCLKDSECPENATCKMQPAGVLGKGVCTYDS